MIMTSCNLKHHSLFSNDLILHATNIEMDNAIKTKNKRISIGCSNCKKKKEEDIRNKLLSPSLFPTNQKTQLVFLLVWLVLILAAS